MQKRVWIIGASSGIGLELVKVWLKEGHKVILSSRHAQDSFELLSLKTTHENQLVLLNIDVTDQNKITQVAKTAWETFSGLDWCFYNAGDYDVMKLHTLDIKKFEQMNSVNYLGAVRVFHAISKYFLKMKKGRIIWNASLSSYFGLPYGGAYSAPKAALVNLAQSLQPELLQQGVELQIINHGFVKTRLTQKNDFEMPELMEPTTAAQNINTGLKEPYHFEIRFPFKLTLFLRVLHLLPTSWALAITRKMLQ